MGFIKDCIETKRKEREQVRIEEMKRAALIELD